MIASTLLNKGIVRRIVYVCPNNIIKENVRKSFKKFGILLDLWRNATHKKNGGESKTADGCVILYQSIAGCAPTQRAICSREPTAVIFDEIHHLGDELRWGTNAEEAFEHAKAVVSFSGTPWRHDNRTIPFVEYETKESGLLVYRADHNYSLASAIVDGVCRRPTFDWMMAKLNLQAGSMRMPGVTFDKRFDDEIENFRLRECVKHGSLSREKILEEAIRVCRQEGRKMIVFVGGDTTAADTPTDDVLVHLPKTLKRLGVSSSEYEGVAAKAEGSKSAVHGFGSSKKLVLGTVNMVSEGVDIPELSCAVFLSSVTTAGAMLQRIGRVLRGDGTAPIFMFPHPAYVEFAKKIECDVSAEEFRRRKPTTLGNISGSGGDGDGDWRQRRRLSAEVIEAHVGGFTFCGRAYSEIERKKAESYARSMGSRVTHEILDMILQLKPDLRDESNASTTGRTSPVG
jgi:hypothetical protein